MEVKKRQLIKSQLPSNVFIELSCPIAQNIRNLYHFRAGNYGMMDEPVQRPVQHVIGKFVSDVITRGYSSAVIAIIGQKKRRLLLLSLPINSSRLSLIRSPCSYGSYDTARKPASANIRRCERSSSMLPVIPGSQMTKCPFRSSSGSSQMIGI